MGRSVSDVTVGDGTPLRVSACVTDSQVSVRLFNGEGRDGGDRPRAQV